MHTVRYLRAGELLLTDLAERQEWDAWDRGGRQGMAQRAQARAERLLAEHQVPPLTESQERELDEIMEEAESTLLAA
jgi:trimethylamine:corrinoid methyltransferase-like protein